MTLTEILSYARISDIGLRTIDGVGIAKAN